jgi:hypothetical protein
MSRFPARRAGRLSVALLGCSLVLLAGCSAGGELIPAGAGAFGGGREIPDLAVGDCVDADDISTNLAVVPCAEQHDWEVYLRLTGPQGVGDDAARSDALLAAAEEGCDGAFWRFLGLPAGARTTFGFTYLIDEDNAEGGVHCLIGDMSGPVAGSLAGAAG